MINIAEKKWRTKESPMNVTLLILFDIDSQAEDCVKFVTWQPLIGSHCASSAETNDL